MGVFSLPYSREDQMQICEKLSNLNMLNYNDRNECKRIAQELSRYKQLNPSEKSFLENLIRKYGYNI